MFASVEELLGQGRAAAEALMVDRCIVRYRTGRMIQDETTGKEVPEFADRFTSKCKVQGPGLQLVSATDTATAGGRLEIVSRASIHLPWNVPQVVHGDVVEITEVAPFSQQALLGQKFVVRGPLTISMSTAIRLFVDEVIG